jgi:PIN domain nuclease of toxin-antitoxin system
LRLLIDTHILVWWLAGARALGKEALGLITAPDAELSVSAASWWEIGIKRALGRMQFDWPTGRVLLAKNRIAVISVTLDHAEAAAALPLHHGDPFDRMLVAQASVEGMQLLTRDRKLKVYGASVLHV